MTTIVRFAPSPTGFLHIGGARTALINWAFAKKTGGKFLLRIEDTDYTRSDDSYIKSILNTLNWLGIDYNNSIIYQSNNQKLHKQMAEKLLQMNLAYWCSCPIKQNDYNHSNNEKHRYHCKGSGLNQALRIKTPTEGLISFYDIKRGNISINANEIDDFIILRANGVPIYQFCAPIDDHNMKITHIIRGDDHITNTFAQIVVYKALNLEPPAFAHIPLIHALNGEKLSKRHGAIDTVSYQSMGILAEPLKKYLLSLGFTDSKTQSLNDIIKNFDITKINLSPVKLDIRKLMNINHEYIKSMKITTLITELNNFCIQKSGCSLPSLAIKRIELGNQGLRERSDNLNDILQNAKFYLSNQIKPSIEDMQKFFDPNAAQVLHKLLKNLSEWTENGIKLTLNELKNLNISKKNGMQSLRIALTGTMQSPSIIEVAIALGKKECLQRISNILKTSPSTK
ncbi:Glutamate--tRNA ligase [Candidatus Xenohaliotis californiensis]|uniref:Glutamate--tRNA ligase n=1 Tax=Candidatus Xenohaliotis californiensis TaxID=84677 RepID=A0ABM9N7N0_9RICK|nr:Glutamate--tRNA ligase [Candidatus Xenohaliotis californiensis]